VRPPAADAPRDRGSAVVEFVLVGALLLFLFGGVFQLGLVLHVRTVLTASAQEGARFAANADQTAADGAVVTREAIRDALGNDVAGRMTVTPETGSAAGAPVVVMRVSGPLPLFFLPLSPVTLTVTGRALQE
jgi:Flp pilus assembly protein TadG